MGGTMLRGAQHVPFDESLAEALQGFRVPPEQRTLIAQMNDLLARTLEEVVRSRLSEDYQESVCDVCDLGVCGSTARGTQVGVPFDFDVAVVLRDGFDNRRLHDVLPEMARLIAGHTSLLSRFLSSFLELPEPVDTAIHLEPFKKTDELTDVGKLLILRAGALETPFKVDVGLTPEIFHGPNLKYTREFVR
jgi:hypothetical protein